MAEFGYFAKVNMAPQIHSNTQHIHHLSTFTLAIRKGTALGVQSLVEGSLEVKLPTICRDGEAEVGGRVRTEKSRSENRREEKECEATKMQVREKVGKSRFTVFSNDLGSGGSKSNLAKAR